MPFLVYGRSIPSTLEVGLLAQEPAPIICLGGYNLTTISLKGGHLPDRDVQRLEHIFALKTSKCRLKIAKLPSVFFPLSHSNAVLNRYGTYP